MKSTGIRTLSFAVTLSGVLLACTLKAQEVKDFDGNIYKTASYGMQVWTAANLSVTHFRNGDAIPQAGSAEAWMESGNTGKPAWCFYNDDPAYGKKYGILYNWYAINDPRGLAPEGWSIPENADWSTLVRNLLGVDYAGEKLKSTVIWKNKKGSDKIGFSAIPGGLRDHDGKFKEIDRIGQWWTNSVPVAVIPSKLIFSVKLTDYSPEISYIKSEKGSGFSVRCIKK